MSDRSLVDLDARDPLEQAIAGLLLLDDVTRDQRLVALERENPELAAAVRRRLPHLARVGALERSESSGANAPSAPPCTLGDFELGEPIGSGGVGRSCSRASAKRIRPSAPTR